MPSEYLVNEQKGAAGGKDRSVKITLTEEMLAEFAFLTGDYSSLHMDVEYARRTRYRKRVVHGMLMVALVPLLDILPGKGRVYRLKDISVNFLKPVFIDETVVLSAVDGTINEENSTITHALKISRAKTGEAVVHGTITFEYSLRSMDQNFEKGQPASLVQNLDEAQWDIDTIEKGCTERFDFTAGKGQANAYFQLLSRCSGESDTLDRIKHALDDNNLLAFFLYSTFAGMRMPGKLATIMNANIKFLNPIESGRSYELAGEVAFKSSFGTITEKLSITRSNNSRLSVAEGKMNVQVNMKPPAMLDVNELKDKYTDLGLKGKVVLITGASRGIGETTAKLFSQYGSKVAVNYCKGKSDANRVVANIRISGQRALAVQADVTKKDEVRAMVRKVIEEFGCIDVLVNSAVGDAIDRSFLELSWSEMQEAIDVVVKGAFNCCQEILPCMLENGGGKIINISTVYAECPPAGQTKYVVSKSALVGLTRSLAVEYASRNIQVNVVVPSMVKTDLSAGISPMVERGIVQSMPMKRLGSPIDVAKASVFLASSLSSFTTGQKIMVTGGTPPFL